MVFANDLGCVGGDLDLWTMLADGGANAVAEGGGREAGVGVDGAVGGGREGGGGGVEY